MAGTRIFCNQIISVPDWNREYVTVKSKLESESPLSTLASFDLLNPLDNSGNGYTVTPRGGKIRDWYLHYDDGAVPSLTNLTKPGTGAVSFITALRFSALNRYINILNCRVAGAGFNLYYSRALLMSYMYESGATNGITQGDITQPEVDKWYVACGVFDAVNKVASVRFSDLGLLYGNIGASFPSNTVLDSPLCIGGGIDGSTTSSMVGDIAFAAFYEGAFTATQRDAMIDVGLDVLRKRKLID